MIALYFLNLLVIVNSYLITKNLYYKNKLHDKILIGFTLVLAQAIFFIISLGIFGKLTLCNIIIFTVSSSILLLYIFKGRLGCPFSSYLNSIRAGILWIGNHKLLAISFSLLLGFSIVKVFQNLINPPYLWGSLIYHYTFPAEWLKNGNLVNPSLVFGNPSLRYIAMNGEILFCWFMMPLKNAFIADLTSYIFYIFGIISCFCIMRKLSISREIALFGGILFSLTPQYFKHLLFNGNDIIVASLFLLALNSILLLRENFSLKTVVISGISVGLLWGAKSTAMIWAPLLGPIIFYFMITNFTKEKKVTNLFCFFMLFLVLVLLFGGFTYIRNFVETGNPLYPVHYRLLGMDLKGPLEFLDLRDKIYLHNVDLKEMLFHQSFGLHAIAVVFPALFLSLPIVLIKSRFRLPFFITYLLALPMLMIIVFYARCPHHTPSYLYHIIAMGVIIGIYTMWRLKIPHNVLRLILFVLIIAATTELAGHLTLFLSFLMGSVVFIDLLLIKKEKIWKFYKMVGLIALIIGLVSLIPLEDYYEESKYDNYTKTVHWEKDLVRAWQWLYEKTLQQPSNIAYAGSGVTFPLYGRKLQNNVYYVSVNGKEPYLSNFSKYYNLRDTFKEWLDRMRQDGCLREKADFDVWLKNLYRKKIDLLFVMSTDDFKYFPIEDKWASEYPRIFKLILSSKRVHLYEVIDKL